MQGYLYGVSEGTQVLLVLSVILFAGFIMTRLTNTLNLPKVSGYILAGILIGPDGLNMIPAELIGHMGFVSDLALAFIAFGVGKFFKKEVLMKTGSRIILITLFEALTAGVLVTTTVCVLFHFDLDFALILGAIATATAPASTMMTINQYKAKGNFVNILLQIVALDDVVCLLAFSIVAAIAGTDGGQISVKTVAMPLVYNVVMLAMGFFCGYFLSRLLIPTRSKDNRLILAIAMLLGISGVCAAFDISPLLSCMVFGAAYINLTSDKKLYRQINNFTPPVMSVFFILSGMRLDLNSLVSVGAIGICYFLIRIIGKYLGTYVGCRITGMSREICRYMGLALIPQAGVAIGLAFLGERLLPGERGKLLMTIILSSSVLYEMVGPVCAKAALIFSGCISRDKAKSAELSVILENQQIPVEEAPAGEPELSSEAEEGPLEAENPQELVAEGRMEAEGQPESEKLQESVTKGQPEAEAQSEPESEEASGALEGQPGLEKLQESVAEAWPKAEGQPGPESEDASELLEAQSDMDARQELASCEKEELLACISELNAGVEDQDDYDIEQEICPGKKKKRKKKHHKK